MKENQKNQLKCRGTFQVNLRETDTTVPLKSQKGITLIALVITIIVLLILAGVTINIIFNQGIIEKSQTAVDKYSEESAREKLALAIFNYKMGVITGEAGEGEGQKTFDEYIAEIGGEITLEDDTTYTIEVDGYEFIVGNKNYEITSNGPANAPKPTIKLVGDPVLSTDNKKVTLTIEATAANGGNLTVTVDGKPAKLNGNVYIYEVTTNGNHTIKAKETNGKTESLVVNVTGIEVTKYTVTINTGTGIDSVTQTTEQVEEGQSIEITATAQTGYTFSKWKVTSGNESDVASLTSASTTVTPTGDITIEATAEEQAVLNNINGTANAKVGSGDFAYNNPVVPVGFQTSSEGASWASTNGTTVDGWNDGLVIQDESGNQFVWVPVDGTNVTYGYHYSVKSTGSESLEQSLPTGISSEDTQITTYGGFYIGRYEAGIPSTLTTAITTASTTKRDVSGTPVSKKNQVPWNYISWSQSKTNAASMYTLENTSNHVQSGLITDRMWETTLKWLENASVNVTTDSTEWGNYKNAEVTGITEYSTNYGASWKTVSNTTKSTSDSWLLKTGNTDDTSRKNIYDLAGNLWEWTNSKYRNSPSSNVVFRGGSYPNDGTDSPVAYRTYLVATGYYHIGFRVILFVM